jgi:glycosyltransferase involved in cell wall biosynthesis
MSDALRVLVFGTRGSASDALRFAAFIDVLARDGIELSLWPDEDARDETREPLAALGAILARTDVLVFRRSYTTWDRCLTCGRRTGPGGLDGHDPGHDVLAATFGIVRPLVELLEADRAALGPVGILYDTDDDLFAAEGPAPGGPDLLEIDLVRRLIALADVVTTSTPVLAGRLTPHAGAEVRVIRNALDPAWYAGEPEPRLGGDPRVMYHGVASRLPDLALAVPALAAVAREFPGLRTVWLGAAAEGPVASVVDEVRPWVPGARAFAASLVAARPDIGLAPLVDSPYNRARSELHWLEYALAGAPAIVSGHAGAGPYDVVRDGVDGLVAREPGDWQRHLAALAGSPELRRRIATEARRRVLADYSVEARAGQWSRAYRAAAAGVAIASR